MGGKLQEIVFCKLWVFYSVCFEAAGGKRQLHHDSMFPFFSLSISWSCEWNGLNLQRCQTYNQSRQETSYETVSITKTNQTNIHVSIFLVLYYNWPLSGDVCLAGSLSPLFVPKKALTNEPLTHTHTHARNKNLIREHWMRPGQPALRRNQLLQRDKNIPLFALLAFSQRQRRARDKRRRSASSRANEDVGRG